MNKTAIFVVAGLGCAGLAAAAAGIGAYFFISGVDEMASEQIAFDDLPEIADEALTRDQAISLILLQPNGGSSMWDEQIKSILLRAFDVDRSRSIDSSADLAQMDCEVWSALETSFLGGGEYTTSILSVYGFDNGVWMGDLLGFSDSIRSDAYADGSACKEEAPPDLPPPPTAAAPAAPPPVPVAAPAPSSGLSASQAAAQILALSGGGSNTWDDNVKEIMLKAFDSNDNGELDRSSEVSAVTCEVWSAIDRGMRAGGEYDASVLSVYGFDPELIWIGYAFGFAESRRSQAFSSGSSCLGYESGFAIPSAPPAAPSQGVSASEAAMMILSLSGGGSSEWDDQVESIMVSAFDTNGSGDLDTNSEVSSVTCQVWSAMDSGMRAGGQYSSSILTVYGFDPSLMWIGSAVGFSESKRSQAFSSGSACLGYGEPILGGGSNSNSLGGGSTTGAAGSIMSLSGGGSSEWDARVKSILLSNFDSNGSGSLDTGSEISSVSCDVWVAMDRSLKAGGEYSTSVLNVYGFNYGAWMGDLLGFSSSYRSEAFSIANACLGYPE